MGTHALFIDQSALDMKQFERGSALILVLWLVAALSLVVLSGAKNVRFQTRSIASSMNQLRVEAVLDGAMQLAVQRLQATQSLSRRYDWFQIKLAEDRVWIEITPSSGLVDVNVASPAVLQALLRNVGRLSPDDALVLASRLRDWIDPDQDPSGVGGAEVAQYLANGWPSLPRNGPMEDPSEMMSVLGMTPVLYETIKPFLGLNGQQNLSIDAVPSALIDAITGQDGFGVKLRSLSGSERVARLLPLVGAEIFSQSSSGGDVRVRVFIATDSNMWWQREGWISLSARPDTVTPWTTLLMDSTRRVSMPDKEIKP